MLYFAVALLLLVVILGLVLGLKYLLATSFTTYHAQVVGKPWEQLEPRVQAIIVGMLRVIGGAFLGCMPGALPTTASMTSPAWNKHRASLGPESSSSSSSLISVTVKTC